ncbi:hypothetical protein F4820DRAFT_96482 [Hypoxylon rubiginosum]|uniref:Uncharacterized protein n=1 Tax=Hypoxylon rubiginosum TaxID=110542 RepID=A0ACB9YNR4_9PEZI|nr:hypothetical protein F4820DRAFT_96482 [Hypoxylon rubiginosum]
MKTQPPCFLLLLLSSWLRYIAAWTGADGPDRLPYLYALSISRACRNEQLIRKFLIRPFFFFFFFFLLFLVSSYYSSSLLPVFFSPIYVVAFRPTPKRENRANPDLSLSDRMRRYMHVIVCACGLQLRAKTLQLVFMFAALQLSTLS